jgi:IS5 family transposase
MYSHRDLPGMRYAKNTIEQGREKEHSIIPANMGSRNRLTQMGDSIVHRETAANAEGVDGHEKRVEIKGFAMPEGMRRLGRTHTAFHAQQQQEFVAGVRARMESLGEHCRTPRKIRRDILADGDSEIGHNSGVDNSLRSS